jgi:hypothetical protein
MRDATVLVILFTTRPRPGCERFHLYKNVNNVDTLHVLRSNPSTEKTGGLANRSFHISGFQERFFLAAFVVVTQKADCVCIQPRGPDFPTSAYA